MNASRAGRQLDSQLMKRVEQVVEGIGGKKGYFGNRLLWLDDRVDGIKTGHTESAGYCLVSSAQQNDMRLISVVLGTDSEKARAKASRKLLNYGFRFYETFLLHHAKEPLHNMRIWKGEKETVVNRGGDSEFKC